MEEARRLAAEGMTTRAISKWLGATQNTVLRWINPDYNERQLVKQRERRAKHRGVCSKCGGPTSWNWRTKKFGDPCAYCRMSPEVAARFRPLAENVEPERVSAPPTRPAGEIDAQLLLRSYDCQAYGCVRDALPGQAYCRRHLDALGPGE